MVFVVIPPKQFHRRLLLNSPLEGNPAPKGEEIYNFLGISTWKVFKIAFGWPFTNHSKSFGIFSTLWSIHYCHANLMEPLCF